MSTTKPTEEQRGLLRWMDDCGDGEELQPGYDLHYDEDTGEWYIEDDFDVLITFPDSVVRPMVEAGWVYEQEICDDEGMCDCVHRITDKGREALK